MALSWWEISPSAVLQMLVWQGSKTFKINHPNQFHSWRRQDSQKRRRVQFISTSLVKIYFLYIFYRQRSVHKRIMPHDRVLTLQSIISKNKEINYLCFKIIFRKIYIFFIPCGSSMAFFIVVIQVLQEWLQ